MWAGEAWANGWLTETPGGQDDALSDAELLGLDLSPADLLPGQEGAVWDDHLPALTAFLTVCSQWRVTGTAGGTLFTSGLDYTAARAGLKMAGIKVKKQLWAELRMIELGARRAMNGT